MYKITLYDHNTCPICDGVTIFFADNIDDFERRWIATGRVTQETIDRFRRSKNGECVTDYYSNDPSLNIVQNDKTDILYRKHIVKEDVTFYATNAYDCQQQYHVQTWDCHYLWIRFQDAYYRIVQYTANGVCMYDSFLERLNSVNCYCNPVLENDVCYQPIFVPDKEKWQTPCYQDFENNRICTICYLVNACFDDGDEARQDYDSFEMNDSVMDILFADVIGEAG